MPDYDAMVASARERARRGYYADGQMASVPYRELYAMAEAIEQLALSEAWETRWDEFLRGEG